MVGLPCHTHFVGFLLCPSKHRHRATHFPRNRTPLSRSRIQKMIVLSLKKYLWYFRSCISGSPMLGIGFRNPTLQFFYIFFAELHITLVLYSELNNINPFLLTDKERLVSELTRSDSWGLNTHWNSLCVYNVGRNARSSDCIDTVLSVFKFIINIGCL